MSEGIIAYATLNDVETLAGVVITGGDTARVNQLLEVVSEDLRACAYNAGRDLDLMIAERPALASVAKEVTVSVVARIMRQNTEGEPMSQESQSGLGYSWSGTYAIPGGGIGNAIMDRDLKRLGILRPRYGVRDIYDPRHNC